MVILFVGCGGDEYEADTYKEHTTAVDEDATEPTEPQADEVVENDDGIMNLRIYYRNSDVDLFEGEWLDGFSYNDFEVYSGAFVEPFMVAFSAQTGIEITDMWFVDGTRLFVNLHEDVIASLGGFTPGMVVETILMQSLLSIPGITEIQVLINWERSAEGMHYSFNHVAIVENGVITDRIWHNLGEPDNHLTLPGVSFDAVIIDGVRQHMPTFTAHGFDFPTHALLSDLMEILAWDSINAGGQFSLISPRIDGHFIGGMQVNYGYFMANNLHNFDFSQITEYDTFISLNENVYLPLVLLIHSGYSVEWTAYDIVINTPR